MIINLVLDLVSAVVSAVDALLPSFTMPSWLTSGTLIPSDVSNYIGEGLHIISPFFPSAVLAEIFVGILTMLPFVAAYTVAQWVYRHIPTIAGFGPGAG